jgi:hypothetical protein
MEGRPFFGDFALTPGPPSSWRSGFLWETMFEEQTLLGPTTRSIVLQTHLANDIKNEIALEPDERKLKLCALERSKHPGWTDRKEPCGVYNCVGHVWACRRTAVFEDLDPQVLRILDDDGYGPLDGPQEPLAHGDIVTYWDSAKSHKGFWHVGIVFELRAIAGSQRQIPWILSKWDSASGEVLHHWRDCPFANEIEAEFWTERFGRRRR